MAPIIYTPTVRCVRHRLWLLPLTMPMDQVGYACQNAATLFRRPRGMYFTARDKGDMHAIIQVWSRPPS